MDNFLDLKKTPFSCSGSYLNFGHPQIPTYPEAWQGLYLRTAHSRPLINRELFFIQLTRQDNVIAFRESPQPQCLSLVPEEGTGSIEIVFDGPDSLRIKGSGGLGLRLTAATNAQRDTLTQGHFVAYPNGPKRFCVNVRPALRRYQFESLRGDLAWDAPFDREASKHVVIDASGDNWEIAIDEFWSTWIPRERSSFDSCLERQTTSWQSFKQAFQPSQQHWQKGTTLAQYLLWSCTMAPRGQLQRPAIYMSLNWMDQVWSWDNLFNAASLASAHPDLALDQFLVIADHQDEHGAYPDGLNDMFKHYNFSKPPVHGLILKWIRKYSPSFWNPQVLHQLYPTLKRYTSWWLQHRVWEGEALCHYLHGNDSGWDNTTLLRKGSPIICPDLNAFLAVQCHVLSEMAEVCGEDQDIVHWQDKSKSLTEALLNELWNGQEFCGKLVATGELVDSRSLVSCMPIVLGPLLPKAIQRSTIDRIAGFVTAHGIATEHPDSIHYEPDGYWRGPIWAPSTFLIVQGLEACGEPDLAKTIAHSFCVTCQNEGMAENFDALSGQGLRDPGYTWTAAVFLELSQQIAQ